MRLVDDADHRLAGAGISAGPQRKIVNVAVDRGGKLGARQIVLRHRLFGLRDADLRFGLCDLAVVDLRLVLSHRDQILCRAKLVGRLIELFLRGILLGVQRFGAVVLLLGEAESGVSLIEACGIARVRLDLDGDERFQIGDLPLLQVDVQLKRPGIDCRQSVARDHRLIVDDRNRLDDAGNFRRDRHKIRPDKGIRCIGDEPPADEIERDAEDDRTRGEPQPDVAPPDRGAARRRPCGGWGGFGCGVGHRFSRGNSAWRADRVTREIDSGGWWPLSCR